jgi:hypothetical protein
LKSTLARAGVAGGRVHGGGAEWYRRLRLEERNTTVGSASTAVAG